MSTDIHNDDDLNDQHHINDVELRELVYQSLEREGLITHLKAQLRSAVFKTIEKASYPSDKSNKPGYEGTNGQICHALVHDWLERSRLLYTKDILEVETSGPNYPLPLTSNELLEHLHLNSILNTSQPILHHLLNNNRSNKINSLPDHIKQSIDMKFPNEKINDINRVREHFRSLFSFAFDSNILDTFFNKNISLSTTSISKSDYEQICLKWMQACAKVLTPSSTPIKQTSSTIPTQSSSSHSVVNNGQTITRAHRSASPPSESHSSSSASSSSENPRKGGYDFQFPTIMNTNKSTVKKSTDTIPPPPLLNFNTNSTDDSTTSSILSQRNATPAALNHLKNIEDIARGDETPRTRTTIQKLSNNIHKNIPVEYEDESISQSQMSSIDDITVDKASSSLSAHIDYLEDI
ncbi:unnamed protein product [Rotaria sp. Silwood1]|nr:unnamed protein product [Rotaria sp. Silwood1]CAF1548941.1 unnamed protein product [Rotaria sp. Silwood1]CAF3704357.1 unnamed protein product [Rotaria sp. Silwood1]CAF4820003.1 unnamed protein product [Rotaria sp. Silwood1]